MAKKERTVNNIENDINNELSHEQVEAMAGHKLPKGKMLISGAKFWDFETEPEFTGTYLGTTVKDPNDGRVLGFNFVDQHGELWVIGASHSIEKALEMEIEGTKVNEMTEPLLYIRFDGKINLKDSGKTFNKYYVILLDE